RGGEARRADGALGVANQDARVGVSAGLDPAGPTGRAEAGRKPGAGAEVAHVRGRGHPARVEERLRRALPGRGGLVLAAPGPVGGAHSNPPVSRYPNIRLRFCTAWEEGSFQRLSTAESTTTFPGWPPAAAQT